MRKMIVVNKYKESSMFWQKKYQYNGPRYFQDLGQKHQELLIDDATIVHFNLNLN